MAGFDWILFFFLASYNNIVHYTHLLVHFGRSLLQAGTVRNTFDEALWFRAYNIVQEDKCRLPWVIVFVYPARQVHHPMLRQRKQLKSAGIYLDQTRISYCHQTKFLQVSSSNCCSPFSSTFRCP